ncbi:lipid storage droplets surface-binding protein 2-like [Stegodyphus dumicola]|uniref:lipid storage droplets surface-binding protein 2-like n=1 Tax=Stegodyphus dumicola TaxID=202533 RepID=UPI0015ABEC9F|nr:lipid storage droplets surface-binding protein 2-like [Stegodyphus dumicola]
MARGEGDTSLRSNFVERVVKLPIVNVAWGYATNTYTHIKESNKLVNFTLTNAEKSVTFVAGQAKPVVLKFEKQIQAVDDLACKGLGTLEEKIIGDTRKLYTDTVYSRLEGILNIGNGAVTSVTSYGKRTVDTILSNQVVKSALTFVDDFLIGATEGYIDRFLPPDAKEKDALKKEKEEKVSTLTRLVNIARTVRNRTYRQLVLKVEYAQEWALDLVISYPIEAIEFTKSRFNAAVEYVNKLWANLAQDKKDNEKAEEKSHVQRQLLHLARQATRRLTTVYSAMAQAPSNTRDSNQKPSQGPVTAITNSALWAVGMLRVIPSLLPVYIFGLLAWLNEKKSKKEVVEQPKEESKENGLVQKDKKSRSANSCSHNSSKAEDKIEQNCHNSIPEEQYQQSS